VANKLELELEQWGDIIRGIRNPMDRGLKYPYMVWACICPVVMTLNMTYNIYMHATNICN